MGEASGRDDGTGRAFQTRDRWGHIGATNNWIAADNHGHHRVGFSGAGRCGLVSGSGR
jgi:hypothetical protein